MRNKSNYIRNFLKGVLVPILLSLSNLAMAETGFSPLTNCEDPSSWPTNRVETLKELCNKISKEQGDQKDSGRDQGIVTPQIQNPTPTGTRNTLRSNPTDSENASKSVGNSYCKDSTKWPKNQVEEFKKRCEQVARSNSVEGQNTMRPNSTDPKSANKSVGNNYCKDSTKWPKNHVEEFKKRCELKSKKQTL